MFTKLKYYMILAIKKPYLITRFIYKKHLGVIISIPINNIALPTIIKGIKVVISNDVDEISKFYKKVNRDSVNKNTIKSWLNKGHDCFLVYYNENITIGAMWVFNNKLILNNLSGRTLSSKKTIFLDNDSIYGGNVIIDPDYRGKGINQYLLNYVIKYYSENGIYKRMIIITGASNGAYIRSTMKINSKLIGITQVRNIFGFISRKEIFLDKKEKSWNN